jgi:hypothetical protein
MTTLREAAQQALEALENLSDCYDGSYDSSGECASCHERSYMPHAPDCKKQNAITALRTALAQQEQEPVAWQWLDSAYFRRKPPANAESGAWNPLYTTQPRREWKSLSDAEVQAIHQSLCNTVGSDYRTVARAIEAELKEKNHG